MIMVPGGAKNIDFPLVFHVFVLMSAVLPPGSFWKLLGLILEPFVGHVWTKLDA